MGLRSVICADVPWGRKWHSVDGTGRIKELGTIVKPMGTRGWGGLSGNVNRIRYVECRPKKAASSVAGRRKGPRERNRPAHDFCRFKTNLLTNLRRFSRKGEQPSRQKRLSQQKGARAGDTLAKPLST